MQNPPAFPAATAQNVHANGMTLRDWFAGQALGAVIRTCASDTAARKLGPEPYFAIKAYALADAMLAERAKGVAS